MSDITFDADGLVVGVVQDEVTRRVLMVGYLNQDSLRLTEETGRVHFWSRSRRELWEKGATSGNYLYVVAVDADCDGDALLITVRPEGPTCHTGSTSCFGNSPREQGFSRLEALWATMSSRLIDASPEDSYTSRLAAGGPDLTGRKLVEEATETLIAAKNHASGDERSRVVEESADLIYHLLALLGERGIDPAEVIEELSRRAR